MIQLIQFQCGVFFLFAICILKDETLFKWSLSSVVYLSKLAKDIFTLNVMLKKDNTVVCPLHAVEIPPDPVKQVNDSKATKVNRDDCSFLHNTCLAALKGMFATVIFLQDIECVCMYV